MELRRFGAILVVGVALALGAGEPAFASKAKALELYKKGTTAYNLGRFQEAVELFTKAYEEQPAAEFLFNIGQAYRQLDDCERGAFFYRRYLSERPEASNRAEAEQRVAELDVRCAQRKTAKDPAGEKLLAEKLLTERLLAEKQLAEKQLAEKQAAEKLSAEQQQPSPTVKPAAEKPPAVETEAPASSQHSPVISLIAQGGLAIIGTGRLDIPAQLAFRATAAHPIALTENLTLEPGISFALAPMPFEEMSGAKSSALLLSFLGNLAVTRAVAGDLHLRAEAGAGLAILSGLDRPNPFTKDLQPASGSITMFTFRGALGLEYALAPAIRLIASPAIALVMKSDPLDEGLMRALEILAGIDARF